MIWIIFLTFIVVPALEIGVFVWTGSYIGVLPLIGLIILTGIVGTLLVKNQGFETWRKAMELISQGEIPREQILDGICVIFGAALIITPGFITDTVGLLLVLPFTRKPFKKGLRKFIEKKLINGTFIYRRWY